MKQFIIIIGICVVGLYGCHDMKIGYLKTDKAEYSPASMEVRRELNPYREPDRTILKTGADWASAEIGGVLGTNPIMYSLEGVRATDGGDAELFKEQVRVIGGGPVYFPSKDIKAPNGTYVLTIRVSNDSYTAVLKDVFTVVITEK
jgi:hypothetical protein